MRRFLLSIIFVCVLVLPASAHPGRTDGSGGHYNHSTGEYHYHHGYGAHDHYDMDGDGDIDCPHNFEDKTGQNSGDSSGSSTKYPTYTRSAQTTGQSPDKQVDGVTIWDWIPLIAMSPLMLWGLYCYCSAFKEMIDGTYTTKRTRLNHSLLDLSPVKPVPPPKPLEPPKAVTLDDKSRLDHFLREYNPTGIIKVDFPPELRMAEDGTLYWGIRTPDKPFGSGTAFITGRSGRRWHMKCGCSGATKPIFIPAALRKYRPCGICVPSQFRSLQVPDWYYKYTRLRSGHFRTHQLNFFDENKT